MDGMHVIRVVPSSSRLHTVKHGTAALFAPGVICQAQTKTASQCRVVSHFCIAIASGLPGLKMVDTISEDQFQQWLSPDLFSASPMQGAPASSGATGLQISPLHDRFADADADHASLQPDAGNETLQVTAHQETRNYDGGVPHDVVWKFTNNDRKGVKDTTEEVREHPAVPLDGYPTTCSE